MEVLAQTARAQLKRAQNLGKSLDYRLGVKMKAADDWTLNEDDRRDLKTITEAIQHAGKALENALEAKAKMNAGMTEAQLSAQLAFEIIKAATAFTPEQWETMKEARSKAGKHV